MYWVAQSKKDTANGTLQRKLRGAADQFRANSGLTAQQYSHPFLDSACDMGGTFACSSLDLKTYAR